MRRRKFHERAVPFPAHLARILTAAERAPHPHLHDCRARPADYDYDCDNDETIRKLALVERRASDLGPATLLIHCRRNLLAKVLVADVQHRGQTLENLELRFLDTAIGQRGLNQHFQAGQWLFL